MVPYLMDNVNSPNIEPRLAFEDDRQILADEQKACRSRARKLSLENNRRRKAQEERRRAEEVREQKLQEEILQQRRRKLLEATERHQRAHLPPSQRRRPAQQVIGRPAHPLDDALRRIEGSFSLCDLQYPLYSGSPGTYNRRCYSSPVGSSRPGQQRQLTAALAYVKLLQEKSASELQSAELFFRSKLLEKRHPVEERRTNSKQVNRQDAEQLDQTENLSSPEVENSQNTPSHSSSPSHTPGSTPDAVRSASSPWLHRSPLLSSCQSQSPTEQGDGETGASVTSTESPSLEGQKEESLSSQPTDPQEPGAPEELGDEGPLARGVQEGEEPQSPSETEPRPASAGPPTPSDGVSPSPSGTRAASDCGPEAHSDGVPLVAPRGAWGGPDPPPAECSGLTGGDKAAESLQQMGNHTDRCPRHVSVSYITLPSRENSRGKGPGQPSRTPAASLSTVNLNISGPGATFMANAEPWQPNHVSAQRIDVNTNTTFSKDKERECPENSDPSNQVKKSVHTEPGICNPDRETHRGPATESACDPVSATRDVKPIKGILKKQSKYAPVLSTLYGGLHFPKHAALTARDGAETAKHDGREPGRKRLRWFDEERADAVEGDEAGWKGVGGQTTPSPLQRRSAQLQKTSLAAGRQNAVQVVTPVTSSGYHFAKRAWADCGGREGQLQERRLGRSGPARGGPRTPRVPRRAGSAPASPRLISDPRGAGARPESATGNSWLGQRGGGTPGRTFLPRPPPRTGKSEGDTAGLSPSNKVSDRCATPGNHTAMTVSGLTFTPFPPPCTLYPPSTPENITKGSRVSSTRDSLGSTNGESSPFPNSAATGQEAYHLWNGIRGTLAPKGSSSSFHGWVSA